MPRYELPADLRLDQAKNTQLAVWWPAPIHHRLQALVSSANEAGARTTQKEMLAALILSVDATAEELDAYVRKFRQAVVGDAMLMEPRELRGSSRLVEFRTRQPGRPRSGDSPR